MLLQLHIPDSEVKTRLEALGFRVEKNLINVVANNYHNRTEITTAEQLQVVMPDDSKKPALDFLQGLLDSALMDMLKKFNNQNG